jgi:hypothetical protein
MALSGAERVARWRARHAEGKPSVRYRRPADRRARPQRWADAVAELAELLDGYQAWRDSLPASLLDGELAQRLDDVLALRELVDELGGADLPRGFGRD